ncbi:unnamed protein product [Oppiella nova]|uniref:Uncharacterized protein n=1 Tax=Oppiella nova TaxID=334625 RepID=A0A7R9MJI8_9ACAR|nr:unnamed protein product [Oppiella nova]CAG2178398.1 unnamed protein product [Oppiella nova]
MGCCRTVRKA